MSTTTTTPTVRRSRWRYLREGGPFAFALDGDGGGAAEEDLVDVLLAELGTFVVFFHDGRVGPFAQEVLDLLFGELLDLLRRWTNGMGKGGGQPHGAPGSTPNPVVLQD